MASERQIKVGSVPIGGGAPVVVQSMTLTKTHDVDATMGQIAELASAGCEIVRVAVPKTEDADALEEARLPEPDPGHRRHPLQRLARPEGDRRGGRSGADQPGQHRRPGQGGEVVEAAKAKGIPMRIGANSGSLPKHLVELAQKDTAEALVEEALEQVRLLE